MNLALASLVALSSLAAKPAGPNQVMEEGGVRVTLLSVRPTSATDLRGAAGGRVVQWLIVPEKGAPTPVFGNVKLFVGGTLYNAVVNAASSKPMAPDLLIEDALKPLEPRAVIATVTLRGAALPPEAAVETSIELGLWPAGTKVPTPGMKPRYVEFTAKFP